jgi:heat shock protein HtpX
MAGWLFICFSAVYWYTEILLFFQQVRKPVLEEEQLLLVAMNEVQKRANDQKRYRLRISEQGGLNAFAIGYNTIVINKDCLRDLDYRELCALLAHEMAHLRTRDCTAMLALHFADLLPSFVSRMFTTALKFSGGRIKAVMRQSLLIAFITVIVILFILSKSAILFYLMAVIGFVVFLWLFNKVFFFFWLINTRFTEYRQDAFAHKLGLGLELKQVLLKIAGSGSPSRVDQYSTIIGSTHPILHNRIRRLEKLAGLRK